MVRSTVERQIGERTLLLTNQEKVLYPEIGLTKGDVVQYYLEIAAVLLPHLLGRPLTLKRYPDGVHKFFFYEKNCPSHRPEWMRTTTVRSTRKTVEYCLVDEPAGLVWMANLASLELHPLLATEDDVQCPTKLTFDLDPGAPATITQCCRVALDLFTLFDDFGLQAFPKTSGSKGMQLEVPLNTPLTYEQTKPFALAVAQLLESRRPDDVVSKMEKALRPGKVLIDWSQNDDSKTTVAAYSLRALPQATVSTPVTWDEVAAGADGSPLAFTMSEVLERVAEHGDRQAPVLSLQQGLPRL